VSKRSYRRLAVVAGAALAVGSMAPAMANRLAVDGEVTVSPNAIDVNDLTGLMPNVALPSTAFVAPLSASLLGTPFAVVGGVRHAVGGTLGCAGGLVTGAGLALSADASAGIGLGGLALDASGLLTSPVAIASDALGCATGAVVPAALGIVGTAAAPVRIVAGTALATAGGLPATVGQVTGTAFGLQNLLLGGGLDSILGINVAAGVMGSF
jgi:hypothetical protein